MDDRIKLSYFYGKEAEQYSFYKIPKLLFTDDYFKKISVEAKVLYGLMLDRMSLSVKNQWMKLEIILTMKHTGEIWQSMMAVIIRVMDM